MSDEEAMLERDVFRVAEIIFSQANANPCPETGTLGFILGVSQALGTLVYHYTEGLDAKARREFTEIAIKGVKVCVRHPITKVARPQSGVIN